MTTDAHPAHAGEDLSADEYGDHQHGATDKQYIIIAVILCVITAAEVTLTYIDVGALFLPALLIMMAAKFIIVVSFFMHLKFDNKLFSCPLLHGPRPRRLRLRRRPGHVPLLRS